MHVTFAFSPDARKITGKIYSQITATLICSESGSSRRMIHVSNSERIHVRLVWHARHVCIQSWCSKTHTKYICTKFTATLICSKSYLHVAWYTCPIAKGFTLGLSFGCTLIQHMVSSHAVSSLPRCAHKPSIALLFSSEYNYSGTSQHNVRCMGTTSINNAMSTFLVGGEKSLPLLS